MAINPSPSSAPIPTLALRAREAAIALGISARTLWALTATGEVPHVRLGRTVLYPTRELTDWLTARTKLATGAPPSATLPTDSNENIGESQTCSIPTWTRAGGAA